MRECVSPGAGDAVFCVRRCLFLGCFLLFWFGFIPEKFLVAFFVDFRRSFAIHLAARDRNQLFFYFHVFFSFFACVCERVSSIAFNPYARVAKDGAVYEVLLAREGE